MVFSFCTYISSSTQHPTWNSCSFHAFIGFPFHLPGLFWLPMLLGTTLDEIYRFSSGKVDGTDSFMTFRRRVYGYSDNDYFYLKVGLKQSQIGLNPTKLMAGPKILSVRTAFSLFFFGIRKESSFIFRNLIDTKPALL